MKTACVLSRSEKKWAQTFARVYKISMFSNYAASTFWGLQPDLVVKIAKTGFDFHSNSSQVILFSGRDFKYWLFVPFSSKFFRQLSQKCIVRVQRRNWSQLFLWRKPHIFSDFARNLHRRLKRRRNFGLKKMISMWQNKDSLLSLCNSQSVWSIEWGKIRAKVWQKTHPKWLIFLCFRFFFAEET